MIQYLINMIFALDQFFSTVLGGHPDDTISQRLGRASLSGSLVADFFMGLVDALAWALTGEVDHCYKSLSGSTMARELWNWGGSRADIDVED